MMIFQFVWFCSNMIQNSKKFLVQMILPQYDSLCGVSINIRKLISHQLHWNGFCSSVNLSVVFEEITKAHSVGSYHSHSYNYLVVAVVVAEAEK